MGERGVFSFVVKIFKYRACISLSQIIFVATFLLVSTTVYSTRNTMSHAETLVTEVRGWRAQR
jgi:hypothetical protein